MYMSSLQGRRCMYPQDILNKSADLRLWTFPRHNPRTLTYLTGLLPDPAGILDILKIN